MPKLRDVLTNYGEHYRIIACNDGSRDRTGEVLQTMLRDYSLEIISHSINRGLGETCRDLFERAAEISTVGDVIVRLDCDDTHEPEFIPSLIRKIREGNDVVIASRFVDGGGQIGVSNYRAFISRSANLFMKVFFPIKGLKEYSSGFRAYRAEKIKEAVDFYGNNFIQLKGLGFTCTLEKLIKLKLIGARFTEAPFILRYDQKASESKMVSSVTTLGYLVMTVLYHWPWGGWRSSMRTKHKDWTVANDRP
jgi:dolichol-phosphate mannosyltransferase